MIVRAVLENPKLVENFDLFNDARDTIGWLRNMAQRATRIADDLQARFDGQQTPAGDVGWDDEHVWEPTDESFQGPNGDG